MEKITLSLSKKQAEALRTGFYYYNHFTEQTLAAIKKDPRQYAIWGRTLHEVVDQQTEWCRTTKTVANKIDVQVRKMLK